MGYLLIPGSDRAIARRLVARIDQIAGYPRTLAESELRRVGRTPPGGWATCSTDAAVVVWRHDATGPAQLAGAIAIHYGPDVVRMLSRRLVDPEDGAGKRLIQQIIADRGWVLRTDAQGLPDPGDETRQPWTRLAHRDGADGSADGVPIPEGKE